jgi:hypothetical protein
MGNNWTIPTLQKTVYQVLTVPPSLTQQDTSATCPVQLSARLLVYLTAVPYSTKAYTETIMLAHSRPGLLRSSSVSKCCFLNWDQGSSKKSTTAARPPPSIPPVSASSQPQPSQVAVRAAAEQDVVVVAQPAVPVAPAGKLPPPSRSFWGEPDHTMWSIITMSSL